MANRLRTRVHTVKSSALYCNADEIARAAPELLVAQVARHAAARAGGRTLDAALPDGGLHAHAVLRVPPPARAAGPRALRIHSHNTDCVLISTVQPCAARVV